MPQSPVPSSAPSKSTSTPSVDSQTDQRVRYLTAQDLTELHRAVSHEFSGTHGHPGVIENAYGLMTTVQRPQATIFGKEAYPTFPDKAAAFIFALLQNAPFKSGNRRVALAALLAFCEMNGHAIDARKLDEKGLETLIRRAATHREHDVPTEQAFREFREAIARAIA